MKIFILATITILATTVANADTLSCKVHGSEAKFEFSEDLKTASISTTESSTLLLAPGTVCGVAASSDCATTELANKYVWGSTTRCAQSDSYASFVYSLVNKNGRLDCRSGRTRQLVEFNKCD